MTCWLCGFETTKDASGPICNLKNGSCQICTEVAKLDEEINQAVVDLRRLLAKRCDLRSEQNRVHGSVVHRLPVELRNYIFELLLPSRTEWGEILQTERAIVPSYLTSICRSWRDIAWLNPLLWSTIKIAIGTQVTTSDSDPSSRINFVHDWILRSQTFPLTLHIVARYKKGILEKELKGVIDVISQCSNRLHSLSICIPSELLRAFRLSNSQYHLLRRLRILQDHDIQPVPLVLNPTASPEKVVLRGVPFQSLQISWNHVSVAIVADLGLDDVMQLFQHASQMTTCSMLSLRRNTNFSISQIIHQSLKTLTYSSSLNLDVGTMLLGSLTLPGLQEFHTNETGLLSPLPALVHRSSCPLTRITLFSELRIPDNLQPLPGVTDLTLHTANDRVAIEKLVLGEYFPDLRHLTIRLQPFLSMWDVGIISMLLDRTPPPPGVPNRGRLRKLFVVDPEQANFDAMWNSDVGKDLKAMNISLMADGFEISSPSEDD